MTKNDKDLIRLGKMLRDFAELGVMNRKELLWVSFLRGIAQGFGAIIGGTILVALLIWSLGIFNEVPLIGRLTRAISNTVDSNN